MRKYLYPLLALVAIAFSSCGTRSGRFRLEGDFKNINQGNFYLYSSDGTLKGIDTIKLQRGHFVHEVNVDQPTTLVLLFPNYSEQPIFAESGKKVEIKGDVSHLKDLTVTGTEANELMNQFRQLSKEKTPPEAIKFAETFIGDHPESPVSTYLLERYFITKGDYKRAFDISAKLMKSQPENGRLARLNRLLKDLTNAQVGSKLPAFSAINLWGAAVTDSKLRANVGVIYFFSTWSFESQNLHRKIVSLKKKHGAKLGAVGVSLDAIKRDCMNFVKNDSIQRNIICDERQWNTPLVQKFGVTSVPDNIIVDRQGKVVARGLPNDQIEQKIEELLK